MKLQIFLEKVALDRKISLEKVEDAWEVLDRASYVCSELSEQKAREEFGELCDEEKGLLISHYAVAEPDSKLADVVENPKKIYYVHYESIDNFEQITSGSIAQEIENLTR
jgi:hypothetical protein